MNVRLVSNRKRLDVLSQTNRRVPFEGSNAYRDEHAEECGPDQEREDPKESCNMMSCPSPRESIRAYD